MSSTYLNKVGAALLSIGGQSNHRDSLALTSFPHGSQDLAIILLLLKSYVCMCVCVCVRKIVPELTSVVNVPLFA